MKVAVGMITRSLDGMITEFLDNADEFGHRIDGIIATYSHGDDGAAVAQIGDRVPFFPIDLHNIAFCREELKRRGMPSSAADTLLNCRFIGDVGLVPYGFNRNAVLMETILRGFDILVFIDTDVYPSILLNKDGVVASEVVDFFGTHIKYLESGSDITTSEYSGYNILPPCGFDGMEDLLMGVQKADMLEYWQSCGAHQCLALQPDDDTPAPASKVLGGNVAFRMSIFGDFPPFFSSFYESGGEFFLARGEDTLMGPAIRQKGIVCTDVRMYILHDTYKNYPAVPDIKNSPADQLRFYYAITGWCGRNPLFNHFLGNDTGAVREYQRKHLTAGVEALAEYTGNPLYLTVMSRFESSWDNLPGYLDEHDKYMEAWYEFIKRSDLG